MRGRTVGSTAPLAVDPGEALHGIDVPPKRTTVETTDADGRLTRIDGNSPLGVLEAFCAAEGAENACEPLEILPTRPPRSGVKIGVLRKPWQSDRRYAIWIRRNQQTGKWFAGNGLKPLQADPFSR
jgi:hypothetical protein